MTYGQIRYELIKSMPGVDLALYGKAHDGGEPGAVPMDKPVTRGAWW